MSVQMRCPNCDFLINIIGGDPRPPHLSPGKMMTAYEIDNLIDYLTARGGCETDISILRHVLGLHKSEWELKYEDLEKRCNESLNQAMATIAKLKEINALQDTEIRRLKSEPDHK